MEEIDSPIVFIIQDQEQRDQSKQQDYLTKELCQSSELVEKYYTNFLQINEKINFPIIIKISNKGIYHFGICDCDGFHVHFINYVIRNKWGYLPYGHYPLLYYSWVEVFFYVVLLVFLTINIILNRKIATKLSYIIIGTVAFNVASKSIFGGFLVKDNVDPYNYWLEIAAYVFHPLHIFVTIFFSLCLASGLSIVYNKLDKCNFITIIIISLFYAVSDFLCNYFTNVNYSLAVLIILFVVFVITYLLVMWKFLSLSSNALNTLCIHLSMIVSCGIDPLTTPSERKRKLLVFTRCISLCLICLQVFSTLLYQMKYIVFYVLYIICSVSTMILYGVLTFMFRLRKNMTASYGDSKLEYQLTNLETKELKEWEYGMELPPMPVENHPIDEIFPSKP